MTENEKEINSKLANGYWYLIVLYKGLDLFKDTYYKDALRLDLSGDNELVVTYEDKIEKTPMYYTRVNLNMFDFLNNHIKCIEWK